MRTADTQLQAQVIEALRSSDTVEISDFGVTAHGGVVGIFGTTSSPGMADACVDAALRVPGVRAVANCVAFECTGSLRHSDVDVARDVVASLASIGCDASIKAVVQHGVVRLTGHVDLDRDRADIIARIANVQPAIRGITRLDGDGIVVRRFVTPTVTEGYSPDAIVNGR